MIEKTLEKLIFACRWLLAPLYLGLSLALIALGVKFFQEALHVILKVGSMPEDQLVLIVLTLIDIVLVGSLIVMVMFSGYENFVSRLDVAQQGEKLGWLGKLDAGTLKLKVAASIVAISSIHLLKVFMDAKNIEPVYLKWYVIIHMTFVLSAFAMGYLDKLTKHEH